MATIPRPVALPAQTNVTGTRGGQPTRVSSGGGASVEDLPGSAGVSFDSAAFGFREDTQPFYDREPGGERRAPFPGIVDAPTQAFAAMLENAEISGGDDDPGKPGSGGAVPYVGLASKAIEIYETNAKIVSGETTILGTSVSVVL